MKKERKNVLNEEEYYPIGNLVNHLANRQGAFLSMTSDLSFRALCGRTQIQECQLLVKLLI